MTVKRCSVAYIVYPARLSIFLTLLAFFFKTTHVRDEGVDVGLLADAMAAGTGVRSEVQMKITVNHLLYRPDFVHTTNIDFMR